MAARLTHQEIIDFLIRDVIKVILTDNSITDVPVIQSHQDAPAPAEPYITVSYTANVNKIGRATKHNLFDDAGTHKRYITNDNELTGIDLIEEGGDGSYLDLIADSMETTKIIHVFKTNQIALLRVGNIIPQPTLFNDDWTRRSSMEIVLGISSGVIETVEYINDVEYTGTIPK